MINNLLIISLKGFSETVSGAELFKLYSVKTKQLTFRFIYLAYFEAKSSYEVLLIIWTNVFFILHASYHIHDVTNFSTCSMFQERESRGNLRSLNRWESFMGRGSMMRTRGRTSSWCTRTSSWRCSPWSGRWTSSRSSTRTGRARRRPSWCGVSTTRPSPPSRPRTWRRSRTCGRTPAFRSATTAGESISWQTPQSSKYHE